MVVGVKQEVNYKRYEKKVSPITLFFQLQNILFVRGRYVDYKYWLKSKPQQKYRMTQ